MFRKLAVAALALMFFAPAAALLGIGVLILRRTRPELNRPFRVPLSPVLPIVYGIADWPLTLGVAARVDRDRLGLPRAVAALVLPMAVTLFRITSPVQYVVAAAFVAWAYGIELTALQLSTGAALAVVISLGSVGLPGQVSFMATVMPVTQLSTKVCTA